jgi:DNA-binding NarL/FixJ family response regulator
MHDAPHLVNTALQHGAKGFVSKSCDPQQILQAIEAVMCGQVYVSENLVSSWPDDAVDEEKKRIEHLTSTEFEVFKMLAEGKSTQECAGMLNLSEKILNCQTAVRKKLHVNTPAGLVHFAIRNGVIAQP